MYPEVLVALSATLSIWSLVLMVLNVRHMRVCWGNDRGEIDAQIAHLAHAIAHIQSLSKKPSTKAAKRAPKQVRKNVGNARKDGQHSAARKGGNGKQISAENSARKGTK